jgi:hypothetical protein
MRNLLRSSDLHVPGSRQHKLWTSYLHSSSAWEERRTSWFERSHVPRQAEEYLDALEERYLTMLRTVQEGWKANTFASIGKDPQG